MRTASLLAALAAAALCAQAKTITVNNNTSNTLAACKNSTQPSIQAAITAASPGDTIDVCPGTYTEALYINKPLTITGIESNEHHLILIEPTTGIATTSVQSGGAISASVLVDGASKVYLNNLAVDGSADSTDLNAENCAVDNVGVFYRNASGTMNTDVVRNIGLRSGGVLTGCQQGLAIFVQSGNGGSANLSVLNSSVHDYDKNGITANESGTTLYAKGNTVTGDGPTNITAQNGIQVAYGAKGTLVGNTVLSNNYLSSVNEVTDPSDFYTASNILIYEAADYGNFSNNVLGDSNNNLSVDYSNHNAIKGNIIAKSTGINSPIYFDGIDVYGNYNTVDNNSIVQSLDTAVFLCGSHNGVHYNNINEAQYGVYEDQSAGDGCSASGSNSATDNVMNNVFQEVVPNDGTLPAVSVRAASQKHTMRPSVLR